MKSRKLVFILIGVVVLIGLSALVYSRIKSNLDAAGKNMTPIPTVELTNIRHLAVTNKLNYTGDVTANEQANIYSRVSGNIEKIYVDIGDFVPQGKLLASIDRAVLMQTLRQTDGLLKQAKATLENNRVNYERNKELFEKGLIPKSDLDNARTTMTVSEAGVESAVANFRNAETQLGFCSIRAPFSGYITKRLLDRGSYVSVGGQAASSTIFTISSIEKVKVMVNVLEKDLPLLDRVTEAKVSIGTYPGEVFHAEIKKISQLIDLASRTMPVEIDIDNRDHRLKPGMFANIELVLERVEDAPVVPVQCLQTDEKGKFIYTVGSDSTAQKKYVETGIQQDSDIEITKGLNNDDRVVISGQTLLKPNGKVRIAK